MRAMRLPVLLAVLFLSSFLVVSKVASQATTSKKQQSAEIERGRYLVEEVAKCQECHTPHLAGGQLDNGAWLQGAPIWITPVRPIANWAQNAPPIAGLPGLTEEEAERVLEKGMGPEGEALRPPMHTYHMTHEDAKAIIAYLNSLPRRQH